MDLKTFDVDPVRGFLPTEDPLELLPDEFADWEDMAVGLPKYLVSDKIRELIEVLPPFPLASLNDEAEYRRSMLILSYLGHAYAWGEPSPPTKFPKILAKPWHAVATKLGRHPVLSYQSYANDNWRRIDPMSPVALGNIALLQNFLGGIDEEWFILVHIDIEARAGEAMKALVSAVNAATVEDVDSVAGELTTVEGSLAAMYRALDRMPEHCDPYIYYNRVRPYIHGWKNHPLTPNGIIYDGVDAYGGKPQLFRGETGAQSAIIPSLDAAFGIAHADDPMRPYLLEMRDYMPPGHRNFLETLEANSTIRPLVLKHLDGNKPLREIYNACVSWVEQFRTKHLEYASHYIHLQDQKSTANPTDVGTGGTPFIPYLRKHRDETGRHLV